MISSVAGYSGFKSYGDKPYSNLKPGQKTLDREYYKQATFEKPDGQACLTNYGRFQSIYDQNQNLNIKKGDYIVPNKGQSSMIEYDFAHKPELFSYTKLAKQDPMRLTNMAKTGQNTLGGFNANSASKTVTEGFFKKEDQGQQEKPNPASHWKTVYKAVNDETLSQQATRAQRPMWSLPRQAYSSKRSYFNTEYMKSLGTYGHNPRAILNHTHTKQENQNNELTIGTTKTTKHIPGYNGFLPRTNLNQNAVSHGAGQAERTTIIKNNIVENYNVKVPGYAGHKPASTLNDRGQIRQFCLSTHGEKFF